MVDAVTADMPSWPRRGQQDTLDTRALEIATEARVSLAGHEDVCEQRYRRLDERLAETKAVLDRVDEKVAQMAMSIAAADAKRSGFVSAGVTAKDVIWLTLIVGSFLWNVLHK